MKTILICGPILPKPGNNAVLLKKLFPFLSGTEALVLSDPGSGSRSDLPDSFGGVPVRWRAENQSGFRRRIAYPFLARLKDPKGFSDYLAARLLLDEAKAVQKESPFEAVISTMEPFPAADTAGRLKDVKKRVLYLMDPPACISNGRSTPYRDRRLKRILAAQDAILTTPFIRQALAEHGYERYDAKIIPVGFPLIERHDVSRRRADDGRIHLLFCGWLYSDIRSPRYFLDVLSRLDERFSVTFMGRECDKLTERFDVQTKAELLTLPQQPYETALQAMADADILINIGNSVPVHMPSKTLEYINTGKPFVNFYKLDDCPTLYYTERYPLCLNLSERDPDLDAAAARFAEFCVRSKGKTVDHARLEAEYTDCTPEYIARKILDAIGE